ERSPPVQAEGPAGRHHQGHQEAFLLFETRRQAPGETGPGAETQSQEAPARARVSSRGIRPTPTRYRAMEFQDRILQCVDCGAEFVWTGGEQQFFADKNFKNEPKRCKACKSKRASRPAGAGAARERVETVTNCSACGKETTVPFKPTQGRPVFCKECFQSRKFAGAGGV